MVWPRKMLSEVCEIRPAKNQARQKLSDSDHVSFVPMSDLPIREKRLNLAEERPLGKVYGGYTYFAEGDVLLAKITPCFENGKLGIARGLTNSIGFGSSEFFVLRPAASMHPEFLFYFLCQDSVRDAGKKVMSGAVGHKRVPKEFIQALSVPLPSIEEQKRIVAILDEAFAGIETAIANTEKNLANTDNVFASYLDTVFDPRHEGWAEKMLEEICAFSSGGTPSKRNSRYWGGEIPWISGRDMKRMQLSNSLLHVSKSAIEESATRIAPAGSLLVLVRGMGLAHGAQIAELMVPCAFNQDIKAIHPDEGVVPRYLAFALRYMINRSDDVLSNAAHGTLKIDMAGLKRVVVPIPPYEQQAKIVSGLNALIDEINYLRTIYQKKLADLVELKQSLLERAFSGELRPERADRELASVGS